MTRRSNRHWQDYQDAQGALLAPWASWACWAPWPICQKQEERCGAQADFGSLSVCLGCSVARGNRLKLWPLGFDALAPKTASVLPHAGGRVKSDLAHVPLFGFVLVFGFVFGFVLVSFSVEVSFRLPEGERPEESRNPQARALRQGGATPGNERVADGIEPESPAYTGAIKVTRGWIAPHSVCRVEWRPAQKRRSEAESQP